MALFGSGATGRLVEISGTHTRFGPWRHQAFVPDPLPTTSPELTATTYLAVADARAALAALDTTSQGLADPALLRAPALRREAQATSALEGTYVALDEVLTADGGASDTELGEVFNYVRMADLALAHRARARALSVPMLEELQAVLVRDTGAEGAASGRIRTVQVMIGRRRGAPSTGPVIHGARYVPTPPGDGLVLAVGELLEWIGDDHRGRIDPVVAAAMSHYQFEALHPFNDGNGRLGRFLVVWHLHAAGLLREPTLTISPWFEARRAEYYDRLLAVSTDGDWDAFVAFFARGLAESAQDTLRQLTGLIAVRHELRDIVDRSSLRAGSALRMIDLAVEHPSFTVRDAANGLEVSVGRAAQLIGRLTELGVLAQVGPGTYNRRYAAPRVLDVLLN